MMPTSQAEVLLEEAFTYPHHASFFCPVLTRSRLMGLLESGSPLVFRREGFIAWLSSGGHFVLYLARTAELLALHIPEAVAALAPMAIREGAEIGSAYATSRPAYEAFLTAGFKLEDGLKRMRHDAPTPQPNDPRVRVYEESDLLPLAMVGKRAFPEQEWTLLLWENPFRNAHTTFVAVADDKPVGFLIASPMQRFSLITGLGVDPDYQGRGLGKALIRRALTHAFETGMPGVEVHANDRMQAIGAYLSCGFRVLHPAWALERWWAPVKAGVDSSVAAP
jgi:GNAT superfamily N-acetyltransferase